MQQIISRLLWALLLIAFACFLFFFAFRSWNVLFFPHQVEYGEGPVLDWARQLGQGELPYKAIAPFPWSFSVYTPAYLAASGLLWRLFPDAPWLGGRLLSLISALGLAWLLFIADHRAKSSRFPYAALLWLATPYLFRWATFYRPDLFALWWSALGIVLLQRAVMREQAGLIIAAALSFVLAFWSKQSFFAAPLAAICYLWWVKRAWLPRLLLTGAIGGGLVGLILWLMVGNALLENLIAANANPFSWQALWRFERSFFSIVPLITVAAMARVAPTLAGRQVKGQLLFSLYAIFSLLVTLSVGKAGAWENYFLEPLWVLCLLAGQVCRRWQAQVGWRRLALPLLLLLQLALFVPGFERYTPAAELAWLEELRVESLALRQRLASLPADALVWSTQMGILAEMGFEVPLHSFVYTQLERQGLWEATPLVEQLATGNAPLLIQRHDALADPLKRDRWSPAMLKAIERGYGLGERAGAWRLRPPLPFTNEDEERGVEEGIEVVNWMALAPQRWEGNGRRASGAEQLPVPVALEAGKPLHIHLLWRSQKEEKAALTASLQLFAPDGERVAQHDGALREGLEGAWRASLLLRDEHKLNLPATLPPGGYTLQVSLYESETGTPRGMITIPRFKVPPPPLPPLNLPAPPQSPRPPSIPPNNGGEAWGRHGGEAWEGDILFGNRLQLLAHDEVPASLGAGETLSLRSRWTTQEAISQQLATFLHLYAPDGTLVAQNDFSPPYNAHFWSIGEEVEVTYTLTLPPSLPPDNYQLRLGWYHAATFERLTAEGENVVDGALDVGEVRVR